jgi:uncharacterized protein (TIGR03437 family)
MKLSTRLAVTGIGGTLPMLLYSFSSGPPVRRTGAPGDQTCVVCHTGTALNGGGGNVALAASSGTTYTPGQKITFTITVTDAVARIYGFQASARPDSNASAGQAGSWTIGEQQRVRCEDGNDIPAAGCPSSGPIQFIEHARPFNTNVITAEWTAPATDIGPVTIYLASNAANGNGNNQGDHIYTTSLKLSPGAASTGSAPAIASGGVASAGAFKAATGSAPGSWIEIFGTSLSTTTRGWADSDFSGNTAPTSLDGVTVTVGGKNAYVSYISPTQVNALVRDGVAIGSGVQVVVKNANGESPASAINVADVAPAILAPPTFVVGGKQYAAATFAGSRTFVGATGLIAGGEFRPAKAGETISLYGIGFGPTNPAAAAGTIPLGVANVRGNVTVQIGSANATVQYAGVAPGNVGLYQINVVVPNLPAGDNPLVVSLNGTPVVQNCFVTTVQ